MSIWKRSSCLKIFMTSIIIHICMWSGVFIKWCVKKIQKGHKHSWIIYLKLLPLEQSLKIIYEYLKKKLVFKDLHDKSNHTHMHVEWCVYQMMREALAHNLKANRKVNSKNKTQTVIRYKITSLKEIMQKIKEY